MGSTRTNSLEHMYCTYVNTLFSIHPVPNPLAVYSTVSTPHQLAAHLALWNCSTSSNPTSKQTGDAGINPSSTTLIILHNLSLLFPPEASRNPFLNDVGRGGTLLGLVVQVLAWGGPSK